MGGYTRYDCSVSSGVAALEALYEKHKKPLRLAGASMGGFIALIYGAKYPQTIEKMIVLTCVVNLKSVWSTIMGGLILDVPGEESMKKWKEDGQLMIRGFQMKAAEPVSYNYFLDSLTHLAYPLLDVPVLSMVASKDTVIPLSMHQKWKKKQKCPENVKLVEFDDQHGIQAETSWDIIVSAIVDYSK